jgi:hypothetical protein
MGTILLSIIVALLVYDRIEKIVASLGAKQSEKLSTERKKSELDQRFKERQNKEQRKFLITETKLIEISKWIESEKAHRDLTSNDFLAEWINKYAKDVRVAWELSKCRTCQKECRHHLKESCPDYIEEE